MVKDIFLWLKRMRRNVATAPVTAEGIWGSVKTSPTVKTKTIKKEAINGTRTIP